MQGLLEGFRIGFQYKENSKLLRQVKHNMSILEPSIVSEYIKAEQEAGRILEISPGYSRFILAEIVQREQSSLMGLVTLFLENNFIIIKAIQTIKPWCRF